MKHHGRRAGLASVAAVILGAALGVAPAAAVPPGWTAPVRIFAGHAGPAHAMAVDVAGFVHIATEGSGSTSGIWYLTNSSGHWQTTRVTTADDHAPSIAVDDIGVHIAFTRHDAAAAGTWTATNGSGDWVVTERHPGADGAPSLDVHAGIEHVAVASAAHALLHLFGAWDSASWTTETVDSSCCGSRPSLRLTSGGAVRIAYADGTPAHPSALKLASRGGSWSSKTVDGHRSSSPSLVLDDADHPDIVYLRAGAGTWYANKTTGPWGLRQLSTTASGAPDIAAHSGSVAFIYGAHGKLTYATMSGGIIWTVAFSKSGHDSRPEIERMGGTPVVIYDRTGSSADGIEFSRQK